MSRLHFRLMAMCHLLSRAAQILFGAGGSGAVPELMPRALLLGAVLGFFGGHVEPALAHAYITPIKVAYMHYGRNSCNDTLYPQTLNFSSEAAACASVGATPVTLVNESKYCQPPPFAPHAPGRCYFGSPMKYGYCPPKTYMTDDRLSCSCSVHATRFFEFDQRCGPYVEDPPVTPPCNKCDGMGEPIHPGTGNMWHVEHDYAVANSISNLSLTRTYNSNPMHVDARVSYLFGVGWSVPYDAVLKAEPSAAASYPKGRCFHRTDIVYAWCEGVDPATAKATFTTTPPAVSLTRGGGRRDVFRLSGSQWIGPANINGRLSAIYSADGKSVASWIYTSENGDEREVYDAAGKLVTLVRLTGATRRLTYSSGSSNDSAVSRLPAEAPVCAHVQAGAVLPAGKLLCVTDDAGRQIQFEYNAAGTVSSMFDAANRETRYEYDVGSGGCLITGEIVVPNCSPKRLTKVTYPDGQSRGYLYNEAAQLRDSAGLECTVPYAAGNGFGHLMHAMTGLIDENGQRFISWTYDCAGRATSSERAGGVQKVAIAYGAAGKSTVTHSLGTAVNPATSKSELTYQLVQSVALRTATSGRCVECGTVKLREYDANGNVKSSTDWNGAVTQYAYDLTRNLETSRTEAVGTPQARKTTTEWHPTWRLPARIAEGGRLTVFDYAATSNLLSKTTRATSDATGASGFAATPVGAARVWSYTYNAIGQLRTATSPRVDIVSKTTYDYDAQGNLLTVINAAGHRTVLSNYDPDGRPSRVTEPGGLATDLHFSPRGWLMSSVSGAETTTYQYDGAGQLLHATRPDGSKITYSYDDAHRLIGMADNLGNAITYTLDLTGNRIAEQVRDPAGTLTRQTARVYDLLNRVEQVTGAQQ